MGYSSYSKNADYYDTLREKELKEFTFDELYDALRKSIPGKVTKNSVRKFIQFLKDGGILEEKEDEVYTIDEFIGIDDLTKRANTTLDERNFYGNLPSRITLIDLVEGDTYQGNNSRYTDWCVEWGLLKRSVGRKFIINKDLTRTYRIIFFLKSKRPNIFQAYVRLREGKEISEEERETLTKLGLIRDGEPYPKTIDELLLYV
ncbi:MAG: hypothetical protein J7K73_00955 [Nanoarchaeota archaeon]|nr:hypothetical protein [Nanoarchaeota archaeon]